MEMETVSLSGEFIAAGVAVIISLMLDYVPPLAQRWEALDGNHKRAYMAVLGLVIALSMVGAHYAGALDLGLGAFGWPVLWQALKAWFAFAGVGQLTYTLAANGRRDWHMLGRE